MKINGSRSIPPLVRIVLNHGTKLRRQRLLDEKQFQARLDRLSREELTPRGLTLVCRPLSGRRERFIIKDIKSGTVCDMVECDLNKPLMLDEPRKPGRGKTRRRLFKKGRSS